MSRLVGLAGRLPAPFRRFLKRIPGASAVRDRMYGKPAGPAYPPGSLRPVIYLPTWAQWDVMRQRPQYLLSALAAKGHDVYFVDPRHSGDDRLEGRVTITSSLASTPAEHVIVYTHFAPTRTMLERFEDAVVVYDILDDLSIYDPDEVGFPLERTVRYHHGPLIESAQVVIVSNPVLADRHLPERPDLILVPNGVDASLFQPEGQRVDLGDRPVVGFHGAVHHWVDVGLLRSVAEIRPDYTFVLVGPVGEGCGEAVDAFASLPNAMVFPEQSSDQVAEFVRSFSVGVIPFEVTVMTQGVTPIKLYEYLASGVPVVSTSLPYCVENPWVEVADEPETWAALLDRAIASSADERSALREAGLAAGWVSRVEPLVARLEERDLRYVPSG